MSTSWAVVSIDTFEQAPFNVRKQGHWPFDFDARANPRETELSRPSQEPPNATPTDASFSDPHFNLELDWHWVAYRIHTTDRKLLDCIWSYNVVDFHSLTAALQHSWLQGAFIVYACSPMVNVNNYISIWMFMWILHTLPNPVLDGCIRGFWVLEKSRQRSLMSEYSQQLNITWAEIFFYGSPLPM